MADEQKLVDSLTLFHLLLAFCNQYTSVTGVTLELECREFSDIHEEGMDLVNTKLNHRPVWADKIRTTPDEPTNGMWAIYIDTASQERIEQSENEALKQIIQSFN